MTTNTEFDSEFCTVRYIPSDNVVFLSWKKFARLDDYRAPALFARELLGRYPKSNFVVDARNGFEDDREDVEWGLSVLLPGMAKTSCQYVVFIMQAVSAIEEEMDLWTRAFGKYFAVIKAESYEQALSKMNSRIFVNVRYTVQPGKREEFLRRVSEQGIIRDSREEPGNCQYEYFLPVDSEDALFLLEVWVSGDAQAFHGKTEHYGRLQALKKEYVTDVAIEKYTVSPLR